MIDHQRTFTVTELSPFVMTDLGRGVTYRTSEDSALKKQLHWDVFSAENPP